MALTRSRSTDGDRQNALASESISVPGGRPLLGRETWLALLVFLLLAVVSVAVWWGAEQASRQRLKIETRVTAEQVRIRLENWIDARMAVLECLGDGWSCEHADAWTGYREEAVRFIDLFPGFQALNWIDADWVIRVVVPEPGNEPALGKDLHDHPSPGVVGAIARAVETNRVSRTPMIDLLQGGKGFATYLPVQTADGDLSGFVNGVFRIDTLVGICLAEAALRDQFRFGLSERDGRVVYQHDASEAMRPWPYETHVDVRVVNRPWTLRIAPSELMLARVTSQPNETALGLGLALSAAIAWLTRLAMRRRQAFEESQRNYGEIFNATGEAIIIHDAATGRILDVNDAMLKMYGLRRKEALSLSVGDISVDESPYSQEEAAAWFHRAVAEGPQVLEWLAKRSNGEAFRVEVGLSATYIGGRGRVLAVVRDITERKEAEEERLGLERQMLHAQKLESLGVLAGGIAHDFNNILMAILGNADLALDDLSPMSAVRENILEIEEAAKRAAELAKQMLAYSGKGRFVIQPINLTELVEEMAHLLEVSISKKAVLKYNFAEDLPVFEGDVTQIRQVIMNLITNASEALGDESGVIALSTEAMDCDSAYFDDVNEILRAGLEGPLPEGAYVCIEVADTGCGMDAETISKVFDPFFTTKFTGRGLGMAATLGIVRGHQGAIKIWSEVGRGTTFKVLFPASARRAPAAGRGGYERNTEAWRGEGTILVADDEETLRAVGRKMLERMGFSVLTAADGREALEVFRDHADEIACVLLDLTMPHLDGEQAFREIRRIRPGVSVILCSGYNEQDATQRFAGKGLAGFLQKPYHSDALQAKLKEVLGE